DGAHIDADDRECRDGKKPVERRLELGPGRRGSHSSSVKGNASVHATTNTMSNAMRIFKCSHTSAMGRPARMRVVAPAAFISTGTKNGRLSMGNNSSAMRVFTAIAENNVPTATIPS